MSPNKVHDTVQVAPHGSLCCRLVTGVCVCVGRELEIRLTQSRRVVDS